MVSKQFLPFDLNNITPYAIGFDRIFDQMAQYSDHQITSTGFPPYNIRKKDEYHFSIDLAVAGLSEDDIEVEVAEGVITVRSTYDESVNGGNFVHQGLSFKKFTRKFTVADDIVVNGASMVNGMLSIDLERIVPEEKKPRLVEINKPVIKS
jgi:molecular chaperone IbpA